MPVRAVFHAPLALVPSSVAAVLRYLVALMCLAFTLRWLATMIRPHCRPEIWNPFVIAAWSLVLTSHYLIRDLDDSGPHLMLLAMLVGGIYCIWQGRGVMGAIR